jgi:hypothetical protein
MIHASIAQSLDADIHLVLAVSAGRELHWRDRQARYGNKHDPPSPAPLAGLLFGDPSPYVETDPAQADATTVIQNHVECYDPQGLPITAKSQMSVPREKTGQFAVGWKGGPGPTSWHAQQAQRDVSAGACE